MRVPKQAPRVRQGRVGEELREGLAYVRSVPLIRTLMLMLSAISVVGGAYTSLLPAVAADTLHGGASTLGWLMGSAGAGALVGALYLARRETVVGLGGVIARCGIGLGLGLMALEAASTVGMAAPVLFVVGGTLMVQWAAINTLVQTVSEDALLGRVMSLYALVFFAGAPVGALIEGSLASVLGPIHTFAIAGAVCLVCALAFRRALPALRAVSRPRYVALGLLVDDAPVHP